MLLDTLTNDLENPWLYSKYTPGNLPGKELTAEHTLSRKSLLVKASLAAANTEGWQSTLKNQVTEEKILEKGLKTAVLKATTVGEITKHDLKWLKALTEALSSGVKYSIFEKTHGASTKNIQDLSAIVILDEQYKMIGVVKEQLVLHTMPEAVEKYLRGFHSKKRNSGLVLTGVSKVSFKDTPEIIETFLAFAPTYPNLRTALNSARMLLNK